MLQIFNVPKQFDEIFGGKSQRISVEAFSASKQMCKKYGKMKGYKLKIWLNILSFMIYATSAAVYLQYWSLNEDVKKWRKKFPEALMTLYLICGLTLLLNAICNLMAAFYLTILLGYEANQHPAVDEMRSLLGYKPKKVETQP